MLKIFLRNPRPFILLKFSTQKLPYHILTLTKLPFFRVKSRCLFTIQSPTCSPGKLCVVKTIMELEQNSEATVCRCSFRNIRSNTSAFGSLFSKVAALQLMTQIFQHTSEHIRTPPDDCFSNMYIKENVKKVNRRQNESTRKKL